MSERALGECERKHVCPLCGQFARRTYQGVLRHIGEVHRFSPDFFISCGLPCSPLDGSAVVKCPATYTKYESFRSHVYKKHREVLCEGDQYRGELDCSGITDSEGSFLEEVFLEETVAAQDDDDDNVRSRSDSTGADSDDRSIKRAAALFILKSMEERRISQVVRSLCMSVYKLFVSVRIAQYSWYIYS